MKLMSSKIYLRNVRFHAFHGVLPQERIVGNDYPRRTWCWIMTSLLPMKTDDLREPSIMPRSIRR